MPAPNDPLATVDGEAAIGFWPRSASLPAQRLLLEGDRPVRLQRPMPLISTEALFVERAGKGRRQGRADHPRLAANFRRRDEPQDPGQRSPPCSWRRSGRPSRYTIVTVTGRGYSFVAPVGRERAAPGIAAADDRAGGDGARNLQSAPYAITRMIGREDAVEAIKSRVLRERLVTVVGAGGIGKTTIALAVAEQMIPAYEHGVWLVDLAPLSDPRLVQFVSTVAAGAWSGKCVPKTRFPALSPPSKPGGCCCVSTIANISSTRRSR